MSKKKPPLAQYLVLGMLFLAACTYQVRATIASFPGFLQKGAVKWPFYPGYSHGVLTLQFVGSEAKDAGIRDGDILIAVNDRPTTGLAVYGEEIAKRKPGEALEVTVRTPGSNAERTATVKLTSPQSTIDWTMLAVIMIKAVLPLFSIPLAFGVAFVRPRDISAWLLIGVLLGLSNLFTAGTESWGPGVRDLADLYRTSCNAAWPLCMMFFGLYFPEPFPPNRAQAWVRLAKNVLTPLLLIDAVVSVVIRIGEMESYTAVSRLVTFWDKLGSAPFVLSLLAIGSFFGSIAFKSSTAASHDSKRRLRLLYAGTTISMTPTFLLILIARLKGGELEQVFPEWLVLGSLVSMLLFPTTLAYVIVVRRALDVRVVVRQGLQYALATSGIRILQILLTALILTVGITFANKHHLSLANQLTTFGLLFAAVFLLRRGALWLRAWTDRRFFRDAYHSEQILSSLSDEVRSIVETRSLLERVAGKIAESLHVPRVAVFLQKDGFFRPAYALGYESLPQIEFPETAVAIERLRKEPEPARVYFDDESSWVNLDLPHEERQSLVALSPQLLLPLTVKDKLLGVVSLGEKRSEAPYSGTDLRLLKSVASQTALALSNAQLTSEIADEVARREKLHREIEIAREVQERLFPQRLPEIAGLDYFGRCRTALGVGGDYYDFLPLSDGQLGIALGDVSGKGIAAALTMASLQASLRADAMRASNDLAVTIARVNNMVYDASTEDRYATLFYAQFDPATRRLTYVNAGHCPPILLRGAGKGRQIEHLDKAGGTVVGLVPNAPYEQAHVDLAPGDLLVIYTDGFSEAMSPQLEEWGEKRLLEAVKTCDGLPARDAIERILQAADAFASGAPQSDDMTLVILRVL
jgi:sigma-B regulation protein RsbU (phosphoserine phosphatase)